MSVDNEVLRTFNVIGSGDQLINFIEYVELLGYIRLGPKHNTCIHDTVYIDRVDKTYLSVVFSMGYNQLDVEKDAEEIDNLLTGPNKNLTEARDKFYKVVEEVENDIRLKNIEVNEPEDLTQIIKEHSGNIFMRNSTSEGWKEWDRTTTNNLVFENNITLGKSKFTNDKGVKHNQGKLPIDTVLTKQFPNAVEALVRCSVYGHDKYKDTDEDWQNFRHVKGGSQTYADAAARHNQNKSEKDEESGLFHIYHKLWNVMAEVELWIEENKNKV